LKEILGDLPDDVFDRIIDESDITRDQKVRSFVPCRLVQDVFSEIALLSDLAT
jgi:hypothetical protein